MAALPTLCPCLSCGAVPQVKQTDISLLVAFCPSSACDSVACLAINHVVLARLWNARNRPGRVAAPGLAIQKGTAALLGQQLTTGDKPTLTT